MHGLLGATRGHVTPEWTSRMQPTPVGFHILSLKSVQQTVFTRVLLLEQFFIAGIIFIVVLTIVIVRAKQKIISTTK